MNINSLKTFIEKTWDTSVIPSLKRYITIPAVSPAFNPDWNTTSHLLDTLELAQSWCKSMALENTNIQIIKEDGRTPILLIQIEATTPDHNENILMYGHLDKQPPVTGWDDNKGAWTPVIENDRLYGRGAVDDGYSIFTAVTAIKALQSENIPHGRCVILIETCEESGSWDLEYYIETCKDIIKTPSLIICLDSGCGDYERIWITTSLRGTIVGELEARILTQDIHSGMSGMVASSFRILRQILDRVEDSKTGDILIKEFHTQIPQERLTQMQETAKEIDTHLIQDLPLFNATSAMSNDPLQLLINSTWKPAISYIGAEGIPKFETAGNVIREYSKLLLSIRTPPTVDTTMPSQKLKSVIEQDPPYGAKVTYKILKHASGWDMPQLGDLLEENINNASNLCFGKTCGFAGEGGSIPFMTLLAKNFPDAKFLITGALGPNANAHGPNEFLHLPYVKKLNLAISIIIGNL